MYIRCNAYKKHRAVQEIKVKNNGVNKYRTLENAKSTDRKD